MFLAEFFAFQEEYAQQDDAYQSYTYYAEIVQVVSPDKFVSAYPGHKSEIGCEQQRDDGGALHVRNSVNHI